MVAEGISTAGAADNGRCTANSSGWTTRLPNLEKDNYVVQSWSPHPADEDKYFTAKESAARVTRMTTRRAVIALGGNAMTSSDGSATPQAQRDAIREAAGHVAEVVAAGVE